MQLGVHAREGAFRIAGRYVLQAAAQPIRRSVAPLISRAPTGRTDSTVCSPAACSLATSPAVMPPEPSRRVSSIGPISPTSACTRAGRGDVRVHLRGPAPHSPHLNLLCGLHLHLLVRHGHFERAGW